MTAAHAAAEPPTAWRVVRRDTVVSTMSELQDLAANGAPERTVVVAKSQTGGRGRQTRVWVSPPGNLYLSILLRPGVTAARGAELTFVVALALAETLDTVADRRRVTLKWPNDVLLDGKKVSGILLQSSLGRDAQIDWIVIGLGLNLISHPDKVAFPATDMAAAGTPIAADTALAGLFARLDHHYARWLETGFAEIRTAWLARAHELGGPIAVGLDHDRVDGVFHGVDASGALEVAQPDGSIFRVTAGDVLDSRKRGAP